MSYSNLHQNVRRFSTVFSYAGLALVFLWFGGMKFTAYEAGAIQGLVSHSPFLAWTYNVFSVGGVAALIGSVELVIAALLAARSVSPALGALGAAGASATFVLTSSLLLSTPGVVEASLGFPGLSVLPGQFLLKDLGLLALSLVLLSESLGALAARQANPQLGG